jgi:hypothetical protein
VSPQTGPNAPQTGWSVTSQQETLDLGADGRAIQGVRIFYLTAKGNHGSVFIPKARYSLDNVKAAVASAAAQMDQIHGLTG